MKEPKLLLCDRLTRTAGGLALALTLALAAPAKGELGESILCGEFSAEVIAGKLSPAREMCQRHQLIATRVQYIDSE